MADERLRKLERAASLETLPLLWREYARTGNLEKILSLRSPGGAPLVSPFDLMFTGSDHLVYAGADRPELGPKYVFNEVARKLAVTWLRRELKPPEIPGAHHLSYLLLAYFETSGWGRIEELYDYHGRVDNTSFSTALHDFDRSYPYKIVDIVEGAFIELLRNFVLFGKIQNKDYEICKTALTAPIGSLSEEFLEELQPSKNLHTDRIMHQLGMGELALVVRDSVRNYIEAKADKKMQIDDLLYFLDTGGPAWGGYIESSSAAFRLYQTKVFLWRATMEAILQRLVGQV